MKKRASLTKVRTRGFRIVALGGGTGLSTLLRGLKEHVVRRPDELATAARPITDLAAIVTVTDDGGSSGRLRRENRILPPGDIRSEEHTSELQSPMYLVCRLLLEKKKNQHC